MKLWIWTFIDIKITSLDEVLNVLEKMGIAQIAAPSFICRQFWQSKPDTGLNWLFFFAAKWLARRTQSSNECYLKSNIVNSKKATAELDSARLASRLSSKFFNRGPRQVPKSLELPALDAMKPSSFGL